MKYFDAHSHYLAKRFNKDRHKLLSDIHKKGVEYIVNSTFGKELEQGLQLAKTYDFVYLSYVDEGGEEAETDEHLKNKLLIKITELCKKNKKIVAWGEFGIDFRKKRTLQRKGN